MFFFLVNYFLRKSTNANTAQSRKMKSIHKNKLVGMLQKQDLHFY